MGTNGKSINHRSTHHPRLCNDFPIDAGEHLMGNSCDVATVRQRKRLLAVDWIKTPSGSNMSQKSASYRRFFSHWNFQCWDSPWPSSVTSLLASGHLTTRHPNSEISAISKNNLLPSWHWTIRFIFGWYMDDIWLIIAISNLILGSWFSCCASVLKTIT